jgi:hypothetical protein
MPSMKSAKGQKVEKKSYRRPEVHDLGKLEQVQGSMGTARDGTGGRYHIVRPVVR